MITPELESHNVKIAPVPQRSLLMVMDVVAMKSETICMAMILVEVMIWIINNKHLPVNNR